MKKILLSLLLVLVIACSAYGATSDDVYLRRDVFEARMDAFMAEIRGDIKELSARMDGRIDSLEKRIDGLDKRIDDSHNFFYLILVGLGVLIAMPFMQKLHIEREIKKEKTVQILTVDDVKKLINEAFLANNFSVQGK